MTPMEFREVVQKIGAATKPMESKEKIDIYYEHLKKYDYFLVIKAINIMIPNYRYKSFPMLAEILDAVKAARYDIKPEPHQELDCDICDGTGWDVRPAEDPIAEANGYREAHYCVCDLGQRMKLSSRAYRKNQSFRRIK